MKKKCRITDVRVVCVEGAEVGSVKEWYQHRNDQLEEREADKVHNVNIERFGPGQRFHLLRKSASCCSPHFT